jgi:hypothetical protein
MNHDAAEIAVAMKRLKRALQARMRADANREARREKAAASKRKAEGGLVSYDTRGLAQVLRPALEWDGRGWAACAAEIGVTSPDLSRVMAGQDISAAKVFAICDWLRIDPRKFYRPLPGKRKCFTGKALKRRAARAAERGGA